jgi:hypothetical protein
VNALRLVVPVWCIELREERIQETLPSDPKGLAPLSLSLLPSLILKKKALLPLYCGVDVAMK